jgi:hypothetical protein
MANITDKPMAYITVNKGRKKIKNGVVFMDNGTEFEIELYNPTQNTVLSKISVNNQLISYSGVVLRPGERVFLERYLDNPNRFKFETYNVSGNAEEIKKAIEKNGLIKVEFYNEDITPQVTLTGGINTLTIGDYTPRTYTYTTNSPGTYTYTTGSPYFGDMTYTTSLSYGTIGGNSSQSVNSSIRPASVKRKLTKSIETGRVEQGSQSDQTFQTVNKKFHYFTTNVVEFHIKPTSQMQVEAKDINKMGKYCTKCGRKGKPTDNFCASCGNRF